MADLPQLSSVLQVNSAAAVLRWPSQKEQAASSRMPDPGSAPWPPAARDPSYVEGYICLVDPTTGAEHIPHDDPDHPRMTSGWVHGFVMTFRSPDGADRASVAWGGGTWEIVRQADGTVVPTAPNNGGVAWYYRVQLNADRSEGTPRLGGPDTLTLSDLTTVAVSYNPDQWRFETISADSVFHRPDDIPLTRRPAPFPDLPDLVP